MRSRTLLVIAALAALPAAAQVESSPNTLRLEEGAASPAAKISDVAWLAGYWRGEGLGGECEEIWSQATGDRMHGIFTLAREGKVVFTEAMLLVEEEGSLVLKVKHFTPEFVGWEEKDKFVSFPLVRLGEREAYFNGLTLRREDEDSLSIYLVLVNKDGPSERAFSFRRIAW